MAKRSKQQLTKDAVAAHGDDRYSSDDENGLEAPQTASAQIMASRKIAGMGRKFGRKVPVLTQAAADNDSDETMLAQKKSLNANFLKSINEGITKNPVADLSAICTKYIDYIVKINNKKIDVKKLDVPKVEIKPEVIKPAEVNGDEKKANPFAVFASFGSPAPTVAPLAPKSTVPATPAPPSKEEPITVDDDSDEESDASVKSEKKEITIAGPKFTLTELPKSKDYGFKFGQAPPKDDSDSDDDIEIKGPTFQLNAKVEDPTFKLTPKVDNKSQTSAFGFGAPKPEVKSNDAEKSQPSAPASGFSFGTSKTETPATNGFSFGVPKTDTPTTNGFSFNAPKTETKPETEALSKTDLKPENQASGFSFGAPKKEDAKPATTAAFSFGASKTEESKPSIPASNGFKFGQSNTSTSAVPTLSFGQAFNDTSVATPAKPEFSFGTKPASTTPAFSFGADTIKSAAADATSINNPFNFGGNKPAFSATPTLSFGKKPESGSANPFTFGNSGSAGSIPSSSTFNFKAPTPALSLTKAEGPTSSTVNDDNENENAEAEKDTVKGDFTVVKLSEAVEVKTGEENEEALAVKRSKLSKFNPDSKSYDQVGLGELKVLKNKDTGKSRLLLRADASSNVLLNIAILKEMKYELLGEKKNMLRIPAVNSDGSLVTYMARVKSAADGNELLATIQGCQ